MKANRAILVLEDSSAYYGWSFKPNFTTIGEVVFNTGMTGYQEVITDPSYSGQIINFTYPELGNTGVNEEDIESKVPLLKGVIAKNICTKPSNWRQRMSLIEYLIKFDIMHIYGIDTRSITRHLRNIGIMNGSISSSILNPSLLLQNFQTMIDSKKNDLVLTASTTKPYTFISYVNNYPVYSTDKNHSTIIRENLHIIVVDFGVKTNILRYLNRYVTKVTIVPSNITYHDIMQYQPDGILLSNGPGDPSDIPYAVETVQHLLHDNIPLLGICMGHQILSLALGFQTFKLKFGHRGLNHPVGFSKTICITSQNHGFAIHKNLAKQATIICNQINCNDGTVAAISHREHPYFAVQYHPEASPGPHDTDNLFIHFVRVIKKIRQYK